MAISTILFDLDGTIVDSKLGIQNAILYALRSLNVSAPNQEILDHFVGPPLTFSFPKYCHLDKESTEEAIRQFRSYYREKGIFESSLFPEVLGTLDVLKCKGYHLYIATSKPQYFAEQILEYLGASPFFDGIIGSNPDGTRLQKIEVITSLLETYHLSKDEVIMIGDTPFDILPANELSIPSVAVLYGAGTEQELKNAHPTFCISHLDELPPLLASM
ncbi:MAG: HAD hydrolase-like protein [Clostridia bacterium]|nr:HAD hydrolase-like protein [Clostridia bacterium]